MAGPNSTIVVANTLPVVGREEIARILHRTAGAIHGKDFSVGGRPFSYWFGSEDEIELSAYGEDGFREAVGWTVGDCAGLSAHCNGKEDHRLLGELSLDIAEHVEGLIDFTGPLSPPLEGKMERLFRERLLEGRMEWIEWEPHVTSMVAGLPGRLYCVPYLTAKGRTWAYHVADAEFMRAWLEHPHFHMVK